VGNGGYLGSSTCSAYICVVCAHHTQVVLPMAMPAMRPFTMLLLDGAEDDEAPGERDMEGRREAAGGT